MADDPGYVCPTCGRVTSDDRPCLGSQGDPHALRDPVPADGAGEPLALSPPPGRVDRPYRLPFLR